MGNAAPRDSNRGTGRQGVGCAGRHRGRPALQPQRRQGALHISPSRDGVGTRHCDL